MNPFRRWSGSAGRNNPPLTCSICLESESPSSATNNASAGSVAWSNPSNVTANDANYATVFSSDVTTNFIVATGFGFSVPTDAKVTGVVFNFVIRSDTEDYPSNYVTFDEVWLVHNGSTIGTDNAGVWNGLAWSDVGDSTSGIGGTSDSWGAYLTPEIVNDSTFGVRFNARLIGPNTAYVEHVTMRVCYTYCGPVTTLLVPESDEAVASEWIGTPSDTNLFSNVDDLIGDVGAEDSYITLGTYAGNSLDSYFGLGSLPTSDPIICATVRIHFASVNCVVGPIYLYDADDVEIARSGLGETLTETDYLFERTFSFINAGTFDLSNVILRFRINDADASGTEIVGTEITSINVEITQAAAECGELQPRRSSPAVPVPITALSGRTSRTGPLLHLSGPRAVNRRYSVNSLPISAVTGHITRTRPVVHSTGPRSSADRRISLVSDWRSTYFPGSAHRLGTHVLLGEGEGTPTNTYDEVASGGVVAAGAAAIASDLFGTAGALLGGSAEIASVYSPVSTGGAVVESPSFATGYTYRVPITVQDRGISKFYLGVRMVLAPVPEIADVLFTETDDSPLAHELVEFDSESGLLVAFLKVDLDNERTIYLYHD